VDAIARQRVVRETRSRPFDEQLLERRTGLDNRKVIASRECPILYSLTSRAAFFDIRVGGRRRYDIIGKTLSDYNGSRDRTVWGVLLKPGLKRFVRTRCQCWTLESRRQRRDPFLIFGWQEAA
jgi:hypothetical protein